MNIKEINTKSNLVVRNIIKTQSSNDLRYNEPKTYGEVCIGEFELQEKYISYKNDSYGNKITIKKTIKDASLLITSPNCLLIKEISISLLEFKNISKHANYKCLEDKVIEWVFLSYEQENKQSLFDYVTQKLKLEIKNYTYYFQTRDLVIEKPMNIGDVKICPAEGNLLLSEINKSYPHLYSFSKEIIKTYPTDTIIIYSSAYGTSNKAKKIVEEKCKLTINMIRCLLIEESINSSVQIFSFGDDMKKSNIDSYFSINDDLNSMPIMGFNQTEGIQPTYLLNSRINELKKDLDILINYTSLKNKDELYLEIINLINILGDISSIRNYYDRASKIITFFEDLIIAGNKGKGESFLKGKILDKINPLNKEEIRETIRQIYDYRNKYLHNALELPIDRKNFIIIQKFALAYLNELIELNKTKKSKGSVLEHFNIA